jgi:hypothetical protein
MRAQGSHSSSEKLFPFVESDVAWQMAHLFRPARFLIDSREFVVVAWVGEGN